MRGFLAAIALSTTMAPQLQAQDPAKKPNTEPSLTKADTSAIRKLAAANGIDTTNARLRVIADTAWIWSRRGSYSIGMELHRQNGQWSRHSVSDTSTVVPSDTPVRRPPVPRDTDWVDSFGHMQDRVDSGRGPRQRLLGRRV